MCGSVCLRVGVCQIHTSCGYAGGFSATPPVFPFPAGDASPGPERKNFALCVKADEQTEEGKSEQKKESKSKSKQKHRQK